MDLADPTIHLIGYFGGFKKRKTITVIAFGHMFHLFKNYSQNSCMKMGWTLLPLEPVWPPILRTLSAGIERKIQRLVTRCY